MAAFLMLPVGVLAQAGDEGGRPAKIIGDYIKSSEKPFETIKGSSTNDEKAAAVKVVLESGDKAFGRLGKEGHLNDKLKAYRDYWETLKVQMKKDPNDRKLHTALTRYNRDLLLAAKGNDCTIVVSASKGDGATIEYAKAPDAAKGGKFTELGMTTVTTEVERATYIFKSLRGGNETGKTDPVKCTDAKKPVKVTVKEKP